MTYDHYPVQETNLWELHGLVLFIFGYEAWQMKDSSTFFVLKPELVEKLPNFRNLKAVKWEKFPFTLNYAGTIEGYPQPQKVKGDAKKLTKLLNESELCTYRSYLKSLKKSDPVSMCKALYFAKTRQRLEVIGEYYP